MPITEQEKAALSGKRGKLAANISDPEEKRKFISAQGEADRKGGKDADYVGVVNSAENEETKQAADSILRPGGTAAETSKAPYSMAADARKE